MQPELPFLSLLSTTTSSHVLSNAPTEPSFLQVQLTCPSDAERRRSSITSHADAIQSQALQSNSIRATWTKPLPLTFNLTGSTLDVYSYNQDQDQDQNQNQNQNPDVPHIIIEYYAKALQGDIDGKPVPRTFLGFSYIPLHK